MNRRIFGSAMAGGLFAFMAPPETWVTVASLGVNKMGRDYKESDFDILRRDVKPGLVLRRMTWESYHQNALEEVLGFVTAARVEGKHYQVQVRWFTGKKPESDAWLTLSGQGVPEPFELISVSHLDVSLDGSTFPASEPV